MVLPLLARGLGRAIGALINSGNSASGAGRRVRVHGSVEGVAELNRQFRQIGNLKQKHITKASRQGANIAVKYAKRRAPEETGALKQSVRLLGEKSKQKGKKVYRIVFDRGYNHVFQKPIKDPGRYGGKKPTGYYPISQEFGYRSARGFVPGFRFIRSSLEDNQTEIQSKIVKVLVKEIDKITR